MSSCERPLKRSARDAVPSSVSNRYSLSIRTQGRPWRHRASSSLRRVSAFSASSSSSRAASHSSRVPVLWAVIVSFLSVVTGQHEHRNLSRDPGLEFAELRNLCDQLRPQFGAGGAVQLL